MGLVSFSSSSFNMLIIHIPFRLINNNKSITGALTVQIAAMMIFRIIFVAHFRIKKEKGYYVAVFVRIVFDLLICEHILDGIANVNAFVAINQVI